MTSTPKLKASFAGVLFDCDGVLVDSTAAVERAWGAWAERQGIPIEQLLGKMHGRRSVDFIAAEFPALDAATEGAAVDATQAADPGVTAYPGAREALLALPPERFGVVTSGSRELATFRLRAAGLPLPGVLVSADDVDAGKPDPAGYLLGAERLGLAAASLLVVEDAPAGIAAGKAAGAQVAGLSTTHPAAELAAADWVLDDFVALEPLLHIREATS
jgi:sugar-phosphatase